jgi:hypothetical protein
MQILAVGISRSATESLGNPPKAWPQKIATTTGGYHAKAVRNIIVFGAVVVVVLGFLVAWKVGVCP